MRQLATVMALSAAVLTVAVGCGDTVNAADTSELAGRTFLSETITDGGEDMDLVEGTRISLRFTDDGQLVANAGCNTLFTEVTVEADRLATTAVGGTEMGCDPARHEQDGWLAEFLASSPSWALDGDRLILAAGSTELALLDRRVADPDRPLAGTRWVVDTIVTGEVASSMVADTEGDAWLVIDGEAFRASSGCRDYEGRVVVGDGGLRFSDVAQTDSACPAELASVDEALAAILAGEVTFTIEASQLRLDHPDGTGLALHAGG